MIISDFTVTTSGEIWTLQGGKLYVRAQRKDQHLPASLRAWDWVEIDGPGLPISKIATGVQGSIFVLAEGRLFTRTRSGALTISYEWTEISGIDAAPATTPSGESELAHACYAVPGGFCEPFTLRSGSFRVSSVTTPTVEFKVNDQWRPLKLSDNQFSCQDSTIRLGFSHDVHGKQPCHIYRSE